MKEFRILSISLLVAVSIGFSSCGDDVTNEIIQLEPDNTLELLIGTWQGTGEAEGETLTFNKDNTYSETSAMVAKVVRLNTFQTDICSLLITQLIGERRILFIL